MTTPNPIHPSIPEFFIREWMDPVLGIIRIYGYPIRGNGEADKHAEQNAWDNHQRFLAECFSAAEPHGEIGFTALSAVREISEDDFLAARANGWR